MEEKTILTKEQTCNLLREKCEAFGLNLKEIRGEKDESKFFHPIFELDKDFTLEAQHDMDNANKDIMSFYCPTLKIRKISISLNMISDTHKIVDFIRDFSYLKPKILININKIELIRDLQSELNNIEYKVNWDFSQKEDAEDTLNFLKTIKKVENIILTNK